MFGWFKKNSQREEPTTSIQKLTADELKPIRGNAGLVIQIASEQLGVEVGLDDAGVKWLDGYIQRQREHGNPENHQGLIGTLGSYLGECIISQFGGAWSRIDGDLCVAFDSANAAYPFGKVAKHLENGIEDSVYSFYLTIPVLFKTRTR